VRVGIVVLVRTGVLVPVGGAGDVAVGTGAVWVSVGGAVLVDVGTGVTRPVACERAAWTLGSLAAAVVADGITAITVAAVVAAAAAGRSPL